MNNRTYAGIPEEFDRKETATVVLIPVPYDSTCTCHNGADTGPEAFLTASENMELYDIETDSEAYKEGIYLAQPITESSSPESMVEAVHSRVKNYLISNKFVTTFGGEHSVSIGAIRAFSERYENLSVLQLDAHADLRKEYEGSTCN
ncbi:MAG: arginase family protein, partial [Vicingaceae bacterium]